MEQLNLFEMNTDELDAYKTKFQLLDQVKIELVDESVDSELHNFRKYYEPFLIGKVGEVIRIIPSKQKCSYEVDIYGEKRIFEECELKWNG